jgi:DNA-binding LacI/PurR family transcriptional regulator
LPHYEMGQWAVHYLVEHPDDPDGLEPVQQVLTCPLIERESV